MRRQGAWSTTEVHAAALGCNVHQVAQEGGGAVTSRSLQGYFPFIEGSLYVLIPKQWCSSLSQGKDP